MCSSPSVCVCIFFFFFFCIEERFWQKLWPCLHQNFLNASKHHFRSRCGLHKWKLIQHWWHLCVCVCGFIYVPGRQCNCHRSLHLASSLHSSVCVCVCVHVRARACTCLQAFLPFQTVDVISTQPCKIKTPERALICSSTCVIKTVAFVCVPPGVMGCFLPVVSVHQLWDVVSDNSDRGWSSATGLKCSGGVLPLGNGTAHMFKLASSSPLAGPSRCFPC